MAHTKIKYLFILLLSVTLALENIKAQDSLSTEEYITNNDNIHSIGLFGSIDCGLGLSYRFRNPSTNFGVQASALPLIGLNDFNVIYVGLAFQYYFFNREKVNLYGYLGGGTSLVLGSNVGTEPVFATGGFGAGVNFNLGKRWTIQCQLGLGHSFSEDMVTRNRNFIAPGLGVLFNLR